MGRSPVALLIALAACGHGSGPGQPDARIVVDASAPDAPPLDAAPPPPDAAPPDAAPPDAAPPDAAPPDAAPPDADLPDAAAPDAMTEPAPTHAGTIGLHDISLLDVPSAGRGLQIDIAFHETGIPSAASFSTGVPLPPCYATLTDHTIASQVPAALNEGTVTFAVHKMNGDLGTPVPPCSPDAQGRYRCISAQGSGGSLAATANPMVFKFTDGTLPANAFSSAQVGNYLVEPGTGRSFPIIGAAGVTLAIQAGTGAAAGSLGAWYAAAGLGPIAFVAAPDGSGTAPAPDFLLDSDVVQVALAAGVGSGGHFTYQSTANIAVADDFELDLATSQLLLDHVNLATTTSLTFACSTTGSRPCGPTTAMMTVVQIESSDATSFSSLTDLGQPKRYSGFLYCAAFDTRVVVPAAAFNVLGQGQPTKLRISIFRADVEPLLNLQAPRNLITVAVGHGRIRYQSQ